MILGPIAPRVSIVVMGANRWLMKGSSAQLKRQVNKQRIARKYASSFGGLLIRKQHLIFDTSKEPEYWNC